MFRKSTDGYFDIAALSPGGTVPAYRLDPAARSVTLTGADIVLDAGGFGKGYALDRVRKLLADAGVANALVNFGDSSVGVRRLAPLRGLLAGDGEGGRRHVSSEGGFALPLGSAARRTGAYCRSRKSRRTVSDSVVVAVEGRSAFVCEILSTALYAAPAGARQGIAAEFEGYRHTEIKQHTESWTEENL